MYVCYGHVALSWHPLEHVAGLYLLLSVVPSCCKWFILLCLSLKLMSAMFKKLHLAYDKVVDVMATRKRYLATYFKVVFFGKVSAPSRLLHVCIHVWHRAHLLLGLAWYRSHYLSVWLTLVQTVWTPSIYSHNCSIYTLIYADAILSLDSYCLQPKEVGYIYCIILYMSKCNVTICLIS